MQVALDNVEICKNIQCVSRGINVSFTVDGRMDGRAPLAKLKLGQASSPFWLYNVKIYKYTKFEPSNPSGSRLAV